jgi:hypothetical protein
MVYPDQHYYLPYLRSLYPSGIAQAYTHPTEGVVLTMFRVSQAEWAASQGAKAQVQGANPTYVPTLGAVPGGIATYPAAVTWTAGLRVPAYWNYSFRIGPGPARLAIDGTDVMDLPAGTPLGVVTLALAAGDHAVTFEGTVEGADRSPTFEWAQHPMPFADGTSPPLEWRQVRREELFAEQTEPRGLHGLVRVDGRPEEHILSNALALCCTSSAVRNDGKPYNITWTGSLDAPATGTYTMTLALQGTGHLMIDGTEVIRRDTPSDEAFSGAIDLQAGRHTVEVTLTTENTRGDIEWRWTPPGGEDSIVPPSALAPPPGAPVAGSPIDLSMFLNVPVALGHEPLETVR